MRQKILSAHFDDNSPWSPYVTISYRYNPAQVIGEFVGTNTRIDTARGKRVHTSYKQVGGKQASLGDYAKYIQRFDKIFHGINNVSKIRSIPDTFVIIIGVIRGELHESLDGEDLIDYEELFKLLASLGFDPLRILRKQGKTLTETLGETVRKSLTSSGMSKEQILAKVRHLGELWCGLVKDYIYGRAKPELAESTRTVWRPAKDAVFSGLYNGARGIDQPLFESGQLHDAISFDVISYQSEEMREYASQLVDEANAMKEIARGQSMGKWSHTERAKQKRVKEYYGRVHLEEVIGKRAEKLVAIASDRGMKLQRAVAELKIRGTLGRTFKFEKSKIRNVPANPTPRQIESLERRLFSFIGLRRVDIQRKIDSLEKQIVTRIEHGMGADVSAKTRRLIEDLQDKRTLLASRGNLGSVILKEIGHASVLRSGTNKPISTEEAANLKDFMSEDREATLLGIADEYERMVKGGFSQGDIMVELMKSGLSRNDVRLAVFAKETLKKYGREI